MIVVAIARLDRLAGPALPQDVRLDHARRPVARGPAADRRRPLRAGRRATRSRLRCGPISVPFATPVPLLALRLHASPANIVVGPVTPRHLPRDGDPRPSVASTSSTRTTRQRAGAVPPGFRLTRRQPLVAGLLAAAADRPGAISRVSGPCTLRRGPACGASAGRGSGQGAPAAPAGTRLRLLPSGPDLVRGPTSQGTLPINAPAGGACRATRPSGGNSAPLERIASSGHR